MPVDRLSSLDDGYEDGDLSIFPGGIDTKETLFEAKNNAETVLTKTLSASADFFTVEDTSGFPDKGLIRIGEELIYYDEKGTGIFQSLKRSFAGSRLGRWRVGTKVSHAVMAEPHNAVKDALLNIQEFLGLSVNPDADSFNGKLIAFEKRFLAPKALFRGFPKIGESPLIVSFNNFSVDTNGSKFLWDFGDGSTSTEVAPDHTYLVEGDFSVQLRIITSTGENGVSSKRNYIKVRDDQGLGLMYVTPEMGSTSTTFTLVDQTDGDIVERHWSFGDGEIETVSDPDIHTITHTYSTAGTFEPTLLAIFADQSLKRVTLTNEIVVI